MPDTTLSLSNLFSYCDAPRAWGVYFQDNANTQIADSVVLHDNIMFYLVLIAFGVGWILISTFIKYVNSKSLINKLFINHGTLIELIWTITPAFILILIAFPTFKLLYLMDEVTDPSLSVFVEGHQWYWSYQYPDFFLEQDDPLDFDSGCIYQSNTQPHQNGSVSNSDAQGLNRIGQCTHDDFTRITCSSQVRANTTNCDFTTERDNNNLPTTHRAFNFVGDIAYYCRNCNATACKDCHTPDPTPPLQHTNGTNGS